MRRTLQLLALVLLVLFGLACDTAPRRYGSGPVNPPKTLHVFTVAGSPSCSSGCSSPGLILWIAPPDVVTVNVYSAAATGVVSTNVVTPLIPGNAYVLVPNSNSSNLGFYHVTQFGLVGETWSTVNLANGVFSYVSAYASTASNPVVLPVQPSVWYRSDIGVLVSSSTGAVEDWYDLSNNNNNAAAGTVAPTYVASDPQYNGRPTVNFNAATTYTMPMTALLPSQPFTVYVVGQSTSWVSGQQEFFGDSTNDLTIYWEATASGPWAMYAGSALASSNSTQNTPLAFAGVFNTTSSALYIDNSQTAAASGTAGSTSPSGTESLGGYTTNNEVLTGKIAEFMVVADADSSAQRAAIFAYLNALYQQGWS